MTSGMRININRCMINVLVRYVGLVVGGAPHNNQTNPVRLVPLPTASKFHRHLLNRLTDRDMHVT